MERRNLNVQSEQWNGQAIEGLRINNPCIIYSLDKTKFYVSGTKELAREWLSVEKGDDGKYKSWPFMMWEIKSHPDREPCDETHPLVKLYFEMFGHHGLETRAYYGDKKVELGQWINKTSDGKIIITNE